MDPRLFDLIWEAYRQSGRERLHQRRVRLSLAVDQLDAAQPQQGCRQEEPAYARQGDGLLHSRREAEEAARDRPQDAGRRRRLLSELRIALRAFRRRQRPPLAQDEPQGADRAVPRRQDAARAVRRQAAARLQPGARLLPVAQEERQHRGRQPCQELRVRPRSGGLLAAFFGGGGGADDEEDSSTRRPSVGGRCFGSGAADQGGEAGQGRRQAAPRPDDASRSRPTSKPAKAESKAVKADNKIRILPPELANPVDLPSEPQPETIVAALPARDVPVPISAPRPQVDVGPADQIATAGLYAAPAQPGTGPSAADRSLADQTAAAEPQVALNIPLPMRRPGDAPPPECRQISRSEAEAVIVAAATDDVASDSDLQAPLPVMRPDDATDDEADEAADDEIAPIIAAGEDPAEGRRSLYGRIAAAGDAGGRGLPDFARGDHSGGEADGSDDDQLCGDAAHGAGQPSSRHRSDFGSQVRGQDHGQVGACVRQGGEARGQGGGRGGAAAGRALGVRQLLWRARDTKPPTFGQNLVRAAPSEVYTAGFQQGTVVADANRFTGKAVTFMTMARFRTN